MANPELLAVVKTWKNVNETKAIDENLTREGVLKIVADFGDQLLQKLCGVEEGVTGLNSEY